MDTYLDKELNKTNNLVHFINNIFTRLENAKDHTISDLPLVGSPWPTFIILTIYLITVKLGPTIMQNRPPINPKKWISYYNMYQIVANAILCYLSIHEMLHPDNSIKCLRLGRTSAMIVYFSYLNKLTDLIETYFFIVKKSWRQLSFLHIYHHIMIISYNYVDIYFQPGGLSVFMISLNTFVHTVMYTYYLLSSYMPMPFFKKTVTQIQLIQFVIGNSMYVGTLLFSNCITRKAMPLLLVNILQGFYLKYIFGKFYIKTYWTKKNV